MASRKSSKNEDDLTGIDIDGEDGLYYRTPSGPVLRPDEKERMRVFPALVTEEGKGRRDEQDASLLQTAELLQPRVTISLGSKEATCIRFSTDGALVAVSNNSGRSEVYRTIDGGLVHSLDPQITQEKRPCTCLRFRPASSADLTRNVLVTGDAYGAIRWWHATSGKRLSHVSEGDNQIYTLDYRPNGQLFVTSGLDFKVRVYDEATRKLVQTLSDGDGQTTAGHSNRVFAVKWHPDDASVILSAGWDNTIQVWDMRIGCSVRSIFGPQICGDALDMKENTILTGSWRVQDQLQTWDYGTGDLIRTIPWPEVKRMSEPARLYSVQFGRGACRSMVAAGGSSTNEVRVLQDSSGQVLGVFKAKKAIYSLAFSPVDTQLAVAAMQEVHLIDVKSLAEKAERVVFST